MPPVAEDYFQTVARLIKARAGGITSKQKLYAKMAQIGGQTESTWKTNFTRMRSGKLGITEDTIGLTAEAFGADRSEFPKASPRLTLIRVGRELERVEAETLAVGTVTLHCFERIANGEPLHEPLAELRRLVRR